MWRILSKRGAQRKQIARVTVLDRPGAGGPTFLVNPAEPRSPIRDQLAAHPLRRGLVSDDVIPFSWLQCAFSLFAYVWLLTNFVRSSFAIRQMNSYNTVEPNVFVNFGPYA
ncbi:hypothetical protein Gpo141_00007467, partial [Globisporangium polare]